MHFLLRKNFFNMKRRQRKNGIFKSLDLMFAGVLLLAEADRKFEKYFVRHHIGLEEMPREKFRLFFRFRSYADFCRLLLALELPERITCSNGTSVSAEFALAVVLRCLAFPNRWVDTMDLLGRERTQLSRIFNTTIDLIYDKKGVLLESLGWVSRDRIETYAKAVFRASKQRYEHCWGFIDGTARAICKPKIYQEDYYSGHCGCHVMKFQSVVTPDGLILNMYGPVEGRRHDAYMLLKSQLRTRMKRKSLEWGNPDYCLYADKGYTISPEIQTPYKGINLTPEEVQFNIDMAGCRVAVETGFLKIARSFAYGNYSRNQQMLWQQTAKIYLISALFTNCQTCLYGCGLIGGKFKVEAPTLEEYLAPPGFDFAIERSRP